MKRVLITLTLALAAVSCRGGSSTGTSGDGKLTIAVIPKGTSHVFWQMIHGGAEKAAQAASGRTTARARSVFIVPPDFERGP